MTQRLAATEVQTMFVALVTNAPMQPDAVTFVALQTTSVRVALRKATINHVQLNLKCVWTESVLIPCVEDMVLQNASALRQNTSVMCAAISSIGVNQRCISTRFVNCVKYHEIPSN